MPATCELHFQEGFLGQKIEVLLDDRRVAEVAPRTRPQIGLAIITKITAQDGQKVTVMMVSEQSDGNDTVSAVFDRQKPYLTLNLVDGSLTVRATDTLPGYL